MVSISTPSSVAAGEPAGATPLRSTVRDAIRALIVDGDLPAGSARLLRQHGDPAAIHHEHLALLDAILAGDVAAVESLSAAYLVTSRAALADHAPESR